jgi:predicted ATPase
MSFFSRRFARKGLYLMDEPENACHRSGSSNFCACCAGFVERGDVQFIIATHFADYSCVPGCRDIQFRCEPESVRVRTRIRIITGFTGIS